MPGTITMMSNTQDSVGSVGQPCRADGWYGHSEGLHTVVCGVVNFTGRLAIQASLALHPGDEDWFDVDLGGGEFHMDFPQNPLLTSGSQETQGDTGSRGVTFRINALWLRAVMSRDHLGNWADQQELSSMGYVNKVVLCR